MKSLKTLDKTLGALVGAALTSYMMATLADDLTDNVLGGGDLVWLFLALALISQVMLMFVTPVQAIRRRRDRRKAAHEARLREQGY